MAMDSEEAVKGPLVSALEAVASSTRLKMLKLLSKRQMNYTELMGALGFSRSRDAGKFSYHLKKLLSSRLIDVERGSRKYRLTKNGRLVLEYVESLEKSMGAKEMIIVRRSKHIVEPFDREKIAAALVREAKLTPKLASEVAALAEEKLENLKIEYLTAPLIRELVNSILLDMGLEKYRHRLTRVGMPVYDVSKLLRRAAEKGDAWEFIEEAAAAVSREYTLLNVLPRKAAEAHLTGLIDLYPMKTLLTGVVARSYDSGWMGEGAQAAARLVYDLIEVRYELNLRSLGDGEAASAVLQLGLPKGRILSITIDEEELGEKKFKTFIEPLPAKSKERLRILVKVDEPSSRKITRIDEAMKKLGVKYALVLGDGVTAYGYRIKRDSAVSNISGILSVNAPAAVREAERDLERALARIRELSRHGVSGLKKVREEGGFWRREEERVFVASLCGLFEAAKLLAGVGPQVSRESLEYAKAMVSAFREELKKVERMVGEIRVVARAPKAAAERMAHSDARRFRGVDEKRYSYLAVPSAERFRSIEDRVRVEAELAPLMEGGHVAAVRPGRRQRMIEEMTALADALRGLNQWTVIQPEW